MSEALRVLVIEDSEDDTQLIVRELRRAGFEPVFERVESPAAMSAALEVNQWDLIISDCSMPRFGGAAALLLCQERGLDVPFISVSGTIGEDAAVEMMKAGADDYVMKTNLGRLAPAIKRELRAAHARQARHQAEAARAHLAAIVESCDDAIISKTLEGVILSWNSGAQRIYGYTAAEMIGQSISLLMPPYRPHELPEIFEKIKRGVRVEAFETVRLRKDRSPVEVSLTVSPIKDSHGQVVGASTVARDITRRKQEENERLSLIQDLTAALAQMKNLSGVWPLCSVCKRVLTEPDRWLPIEQFIKERSQLDFSEQVCPDCHAPSEKRR
ncbi:putative PAS/PAC sensor protein [Verrucomicrobia bacterium]|nr:putative PAS/PAC sensor protein [Verrucomicrobiota bacterium]